MEFEVNQDESLKSHERQMIDSAQAYNEEHVGIALEESGIPREEIFLVSKVHPRLLRLEV